MFEVTVTFFLNEEVTPELFAKKVARACAKGGALRVGERVGALEAGISGLWEYTGDVDIRAFGKPFGGIRVPNIERLQP